MMTEQQCFELRDLLIAEVFPVGHHERVFRYIYVAPEKNTGVLTVYYAYAAPVWERAGCTVPSDDFVLSLIDKTPYKNTPLQVQYHDYLRNGWPFPWHLSGKCSSNDFPTLIVQEHADGSVTGVVVRDSNLRQTDVKFASTYVEPEEVEFGLDELRALAQHEKYKGWYKDFNIEASSLDEAMAQTPETDHGQKSVLVYRNNEWLSGLWTNPTKTYAGRELILSSVADFHGTRVSKLKKATRAGLGTVRANQTIQGDYAVLDHAYRLLKSADAATRIGEFENIPAIRHLCDWWNANAPENMRHAACFRVYTWNDDTSIFDAGDYEEPAMLAEALVGGSCYAVFEEEDRPLVVVQFYRGREYNKEDRGYTLTYYADGEPGMDIGMDPHEVDEAYYSHRGLEHLVRLDDAY